MAEKPKPAAPAQPTDAAQLKIVLQRAAAGATYSGDALVLHELSDQLDSAPQSADATATLKRERDEARAERDKAHERADALEKQVAALQGKK